MKILLRYLNPVSTMPESFFSYWKHIILASLIFGLGWLINDHREDVYKGMIQYYIAANDSYEHKLAIQAATRWALIGAAIWCYGLWLMCWSNHVYARAHKMGIGVVLFNWLLFVLMLFITWHENADRMAHFFHRSVSVTTNFPIHVVVSIYLLVIGFLLSKGVDLRFSRIFGFFKAVSTKATQGGSDN